MQGALGGMNHNSAVATHTSYSVHTNTHRLIFQVTAATLCLLILTAVTSDLYEFSDLIHPLQKSDFFVVDYSLSLSCFLKTGEKKSFQPFSNRNQTLSITECYWLPH